jgi:hypothetical protein
MRRGIIAGLLVLLALGCRHEGFQREHKVKVLHIFGIGWVREKTETNDVKAFAIGSLDTGYYQVGVNTNAPIIMTTVFRSRAAIVRTNDPNPLGIQPRAP